MKRLFALLLTCLLLLSLVSCAGDRAEPPVPPGGTGSTGDPAVDTPPSEDAGTADSTDPPEDAALAGDGDQTGDTGQAVDGPSEPEDYGAPRYTRAELPRMDGSTATAPLAKAVCAQILGVAPEDLPGDLISFSRTTNSYYNLMDGWADLLLVSEGNEEVYAAREKQGFAWEQTPVALDAFVFVVNEDNPVDSITVDEARDIYSGKITNWSEVGGEDREIIPLQRNPEAGSQSLMEKLVMQGTPMLEPRQEFIAGSMGDLMEYVRGYDDSPGAIGYSVYYYAREMRAAQGLKLLRVNGVAPEPEAIRSGEYPLTNPYYVVIPASAPEGSPARVIRDWLLSEGGQRLAAEQGYVSVYDFPTADLAYPPEVGGRVYPERMEELLPADYGGLTPYAGLRLSDDWYARTGCVYGLMTLDGRVVVDPVYGEVYAGGGLLVLGRTVDGRQMYAAASLTGEWVTDFAYTGWQLSETGAVLFTDTDLTLLRADGTEAYRLTPEKMGITREQFERMSVHDVGFGSQWHGDLLSVEELWEEGMEDLRILCFDLTSGELRRVPDMDWYNMGEVYPDETPPFENAYGVYDSALGYDAPFLWEKWDYDGSRDKRTYYRQDGTPLPQLTLPGVGDFSELSLTNGVVEKLTLDMAEYYDLASGQLIFRTYLNFGG